MPAPAWGNRDLFRPRPHSHYSSGSSGLTSVSLREQLHKNTADYFSVKEVRGSSPAASLAADLSQNFRLDNEARLVQLTVIRRRSLWIGANMNISFSPQFPTPRRALFTANMMGGMESRRESRHHDLYTRRPLLTPKLDYVTTPPLPSSSPAPIVEHMELSPLPHKTPFCAHIEIGSPTPGSTPSDDQDMVLDSPAPISRQISSESTKSFLAE